MSNKFDLESAGNELIKQLTQNMNDACLTAVRYAGQECPADQGYLRASIDFEVETKEDTVTGYIGSNLEYAPYVHQGTGIYAVEGNGRKTPWGYTVEKGKYKGKHWTVGQKPNPFLVRAIKKMRKEFPEIMAGGK